MILSIFNAGEVLLLDLNTGKELLFSELPPDTPYSTKEHAIQIITRMIINPDTLRQPTTNPLEMAFDHHLTENWDKNPDKWVKITEQTSKIYLPDLKIPT